MNYDDLKRRLTIDLLRIDDELTQMPFLIQEGAEAAAAISNDLNAADFELDVLKAQVAADLRTAESYGSRPPSETRIAGMIDIDPRIQEAKKKVDEIKYQYRMVNDLVSALREKSRLLGKVSDLIIAGYLSPNSAKTYREDVRRRRDG